MTSPIKLPRPVLSGRKQKPIDSLHVYKMHSQHARARCFVFKRIINDAHCYPEGFRTKWNREPKIITGKSLIHKRS